jgi:hypothetical protein
LWNQQKKEKDKNMNRLNSRLLTARGPLLGKTLNKLTRAIATLSILGIACMNGSAQVAQLMLDPFSSGNYTKTLLNGQAQDLYSAPLAPGGLLGPTRETVFTVGGTNPVAALNIGNGLCILDSGFGALPGLQIYYAPLGLNLGGYSAFRLNFAGISSTAPLGVEIAVWLHSGAVYGAQAQLPTSPNTFFRDFPFSSLAQAASRSLTSVILTTSVSFFGAAPLFSG